MLSFGPPYFQVEGMTVMSDFHDPLQFYYFPNRPKLSVDEQGRPAIRFIILKEAQDEIERNPDGTAAEDDVAGFLVFDTDLAWDSEAVRKAERFIKREMDLADTPRLAPLPYKGGTVQLTFLDRTTELPKPVDPTNPNPPPPPADPVDAQQRWVPFLKSSGVPSLYGDNRAIFSAMLSRKATKLLYGAFEGFMPAGVVYNLEFVGMQTAYRVDVQADWEQAYHFIQEHFGLDLVFVTVDLDDIVERLEEKKIINITASLELEGEEAAVVEEEFNQVRKDLTELVLEKFFEPVPNPNEATPDDQTVSTVLSTARQVRNIVHLWPSAGYSRREVSTEEIRSIQVDYTVNKAVSRKIAPQAHISLFFEDFGLTKEDVVTVVDGNDALWNTTTFDALVNADYAGDAIHSVALDVQYRAPDHFDPLADPDAEWSFLFDSPDDRVKRSSWYNPDIGHQYFYRYSVFFKPSALPGPTHSVSSGWRPHDSQLLVISPDELYRRLALEVQVDTSFPWDRYSGVFVHLRHSTGAWTHEDSKLLHKGDSSFRMALRTDKAADPGIDYRLSYLKAGGGTVEEGWQRTSSDLVIVRDPMPPRPKVRIVVAGDRTRILNLIVDLRYSDPANGVSASESVVFDTSNIHTAQVWEIPVVDPAKRRYEYGQTIIDVDGNVTSTGFQQEDKSTLTVGETFVKLMEVQPELVGPPLSANSVERIVLTLRYDDDANNVHEEEQQSFAQPGMGAPWRLKLQDASLRDYTYELTYVLNTGFEKSTGRRSTRDRFLMLSTVPPRD